MSEGQRTAEDVPLPGGSFQLFIQKLAYQALMGLGVVENPLTGKRAKDTQRARMVVDDLVMLHEKTRGNLSADESEHIERVLRDLEHHLEPGEPAS